MIAGKYVAKSAKNGNERPSIPASVKFELWTKSGGRCEFEGCNKPLWYDGLTFAKINGSNIAHELNNEVPTQRHRSQPIYNLHEL